MKLSEIKEQLIKCESIGVWELCKTTEYASLFVPAVDYDIVPLELGRNGEISRTVQCLLVEALEQFAESRHWYTSHYVNYYPIGHERRYTTEFTNHTYDGNYEKTGYVSTGISWYGATPLQATLNAFLQIDWIVKE